MSEKITNHDTPRIPVRELDGGGYFYHVKPADFETLDPKVKAALKALGETARSIQEDSMTTADRTFMRNLIDEMRADKDYLLQELIDFGPSEVDPNSFIIGEFGPKNFPDGHPFEFDDN